jgi:hypothetical protein
MVRVESEEVRLSLSTLIVILVHAKDIVEQLYRKQVQSKEDFEWIS